MDPELKKKMCAALQAVGVACDPVTSTDEECLALFQKAFPMEIEKPAGMKADLEAAAAKETAGTLAAGAKTKTVDLEKLLEERDARLTAKVAADLTASFAALDEKRKAEKTAEEKSGKVKSLLDAGEQAGKFTAAERAGFASFAAADFDACSAHIEALPKRTPAGSRRNDPYAEQVGTGTDAGAFAFSAKSPAIVAGKDHAGLRRFITQLPRHDHSENHDTQCECLGVLLSRTAAFSAESGMAFTDALRAVAEGKDAAFQAERVTALRDNGGKVAPRFRDYWKRHGKEVDVDLVKFAAKRAEAAGMVSFGANLSDLQAPARFPLSGGFAYTEGEPIGSGLLPELMCGADEKGFYIMRGTENMWSLGTKPTPLHATDEERRMLSLDLVAVDLLVYGHSEWADRRQLDAAASLPFGLAVQLTKDAEQLEAIRKEEIQAAYLLNTANYHADNLVPLTGDNVLTNPNSDPLGVFTTAIAAVFNGTLGKLPDVVGGSFASMLALRSHPKIVNVAGLYQATREAPAALVPMEVLMGIFGIRRWLVGSMFHSSEPGGASPTPIWTNGSIVLAYTGADDQDPLNPRHGFTVTSAGYPWIEPLTKKASEQGARGSEGVGIAEAYAIESPTPVAGEVNRGRYLIYNG